MNLSVSTRDFRTNQTKYLEIVKNGIDVILRARSGSFKISPITENDTLSSKSEMVDQLRNALKEVVDAKEGKINLKTAEELLSEF
ncbi:MAG: prevent-host-death family protein [Phocaeicola sp.]